MGVLIRSQGVVTLRTGKDITHAFFYVLTSESPVYSSLILVLMESPFNNNELLIQLLHEHDPKTYELLYDTYCAAIHGNILELIANRELAEQILLRAFKTAYKTIQTFDSSKTSLFVWLMHIAQRHCHVLLRALKSWPSPEQISAASGMMATILRDMPNGPRQAIELMYFRGYSRKQVAETLQVSTETVTQLLDEGFQQLHIYFKLNFF